MEKRVLGRTGVSVSKLCFGAGMFGYFGNEDQAECNRMVHMALDAGINYFDTSDVYSHGESETLLGKALQGRRDDVVLATKFSLPMSDDPNHRGNSRRWVMREVEASLTRLGTDYMGEDAEQAERVLAEYQSDPTAWEQRLPSNGSMEIVGAGWYQEELAFGDSLPSAGK